MVAGVLSWFRGVLGVLLLRVCVVLLVCVCCCVCVLLVVLFCFGLSAVLWSSWCWCCSCCVSCVVALLVGCGGCVALSAFLLLVAPGWFMRLVVVLFGGRSSGVALSAVSLILLLV